MSGFCKSMLGIQRSRHGGDTRRVPTGKDTLAIVERDDLAIGYDSLVVRVLIVLGRCAWSAKLQ